VLLLLLLVVAGCGRAPRPASAPGTPGSSAEIAAALRAEIERWREGSRIGCSGTDPDCSGFVIAVFRNVFALDLPRSTQELVQIGTPVESAHLRPGDLVFFRPESGKRHVGVYLGKGEFGHVSARSGVCVSRLSETYWRRSYWTARRVLRGAR